MSDPDQAVAFAVGHPPAPRWVTRHGTFATTRNPPHLIHSSRAAPALLGRPGRSAADIGAVRETLLRVSRLADDLPQVAELDLNPVIARPDGVVAVDARVRVTSARCQGILVM